MSCPCGLRMVIPLVKSTSGGPNFGGRLGATTTLDVCSAVEASVCCVYGGGGVCS